MLLSSLWNETYVSFVVGGIGGGARGKGQGAGAGHCGECVVLILFVLGRQPPQAQAGLRLYLLPVLPRTTLLLQRHPRQLALRACLALFISRRLHFAASSQWVCTAPLGCCRKSGVWRGFFFWGGGAPHWQPPPPLFLLLRGFSRSLRFSICET